MSFDYNAGKAEIPGRERVTQLAEARRLLTCALEMLDIHARSQAAATVDLAIHQIDRELTD